MPPLAVTEFTAALGELAARSGESAAALIARISGLPADEGYAFITDAYPAMLDPYLSAAGLLTAQWYSEQPTIPVRPGAAVFTPTPAPLPDPKQLGISARWALTQGDPITALRGNAIRSTMNASRDTVVVNAGIEGVRWVRHAQPNACGFCRMLATRNDFTGRGVKVNKATGRAELRVVGTRGSRKVGDKYHDSCGCTAVPLRDGIYEPPDYVQQWQEDYNDARDEGATTPADIGLAMDRRVRTSAPVDLDR
jgi:hypothetical protein